MTHLRFLAGAWIAIWLSAAAPEAASAQDDAGAKKGEVKRIQVSLQKQPWMPAPAKDCRRARHSPHVKTRSAFSLGNYQ